MLKQALQQKLLQKLTPQQIQMIKLLEIPAYQLEQRIKSEMESNPVLEEGKEEEKTVDDIIDSIEHDLHDDDTIAENNTPEINSLQHDEDDIYDDEPIPAYKLSVNNFSKDQRKDDIPFSVGLSFAEFLEAQMGMQNLTPRQEILAKNIIGNIDDDGYLRRSLEAIVDDLAFSFNIETNVSELEQILYIIHDFDPVGIGSRNLKECLQIQISRKESKNIAITLAKKIIAEYFDEFIKKHYHKISKGLEIEEDELKAAVKEILKLNPRPGSSYNDSQNKDYRNIMPDFILENIEGKLILSLNDKNVQDIRVNREYSNMFLNTVKKKKTKKERETVNFVKQKIESAHWFIDALKQRQHTLMETMNAILLYQKEYFAEGDETKMRPMILKHIANLTGLDISTISRVASSKYIQTHFGVFPLKYFFSEKIQNDSGKDISTREIKKILKECVEKEDKSVPYTDDKLVDIMKEKGYNVARRTIAKYRELLGIPVSRLRKEL